MDKKRRENTSLKTKVITSRPTGSLASFYQLTNSYEQCGITSKKFRFIEAYGIGHIESYQFDGLYISIVDVLLKKDIIIRGRVDGNFLEISFLIEGEQIIKVDGRVNDLVYESQESYLVYLSDVFGSIAYHKRKHLKEIKIRMDNSFIKRHRLNEEFTIFNTYSIKGMRNTFTQPLCPKAQEILSEILVDTKKGLLKRLFLESKILELITLKLTT